MLSIKKLVVIGLAVGVSGAALYLYAQGPTATVTFKSDQTITENIEITLGRQTLVLPPFVTPGGSNVVFRSGLTVNTALPLKAFARKSNLSSRSYNFTISSTHPTVIIVVSISPKIPANNQPIIFAPDSGVLSLPQ